MGSHATRKILRSTPTGAALFTVPAVPPSPCTARPTVKLRWRFNDAGRRSGHSPCASRAIAIATDRTIEGVELELAHVHRQMFDADPNPATGYRMDVIDRVLRGCGYRYRHIRFNTEPCAMHMHEVPHNSIVALDEHMTVLDEVGVLQDKLDCTDSAFGVLPCVTGYWRKQ